jgi:multiple sugar transport system substrate-binding protein
MNSADQPMLNRRRLLAGAGLLTAGALTPGLAACGSSGSTTTAPQVSVPPSVVNAAKGLSNKNASILSAQMYTKQADNALAQAVKTFAKDTGTTIDNATYNPDAGNFVAKQDAAVRSGQVQDLASVSASRFVAQMQQLDLLQDVSDVINTMTSQLGDMAPVAEHWLKINGKWWGIPFFTIGSGYFFRKDWLAEKGVKITDVVSWENARDVALELSDPTKNRFGWGMTINRSGDANGMIENVINSYGGSICSDDGNKVIFNSPETQQAVNFLTEIFTSPKYKPMLPPGITAWTDTGNNEAWLAGLIGMTLNQDSLYAQSKSTKNPVYGNTVMIRGLTGPATNSPLVWADLNAFVVFKNAKNPELVKLLPQYLAATQTMRSLAESAGAGVALPAYDKVWKGDPYFQNGDPIFPVSYTQTTAAIPGQTTSGLHFPAPPSAGRNAVLQAYVMTDMMGDITQKGTSVTSAVQTAHNRMVQIFEQNGQKQ